jgi:phosphoketolase
MDTPLDPDLLLKMEAYWRAAKYLSICRSARSICSTIPFSPSPLALEHVNPRLLGHWGTTRGENFIYVHLNRIIKKYDLKRLRHVVHRGQAGHLRLSRLPLADPSPDLPADQPQEHPRPRLRSEEGTISKPFDMAVMNDLDRFHLVGDVIDRVPQLSRTAAYVKQAVRDKLIEHWQYITTYSEDLPEIRDWT